MSWQESIMEAKTSSNPSKRACKIRKRGCSSSSSSSLVRRYRFKRAILAGKRAPGGSGTPVKTAVSGKSPCLAVSSETVPKRSPRDFQNSSVSARKLAATLWDTQGMRNRWKAGKLMQNSPPDFSDPIFSPDSDRMERSRGDMIRRTSVVSKNLQVLHYNPRSSDFDKNPSMMQMEARSRGKCLAGWKNRLKEVGNSLITSKELIKVLAHVWDLKDHHQQTPTARLISALRFELDRTRSKINHMLKDHQSSNNDVECLIKCFSEEKSAWKRRERDRIHDAIGNVSREIEVERKLRKQTERLNKKLGEELADTKMLLSKVMRDLESEKRAKEISEQVCDELARGIGEDKAEVEKLRKEALKMREEVEKEREMMQIADVLREERVQMKLSEAKYQFEEKNAMVEKLRIELAEYMRKKLEGKDENGSPGFERIKGHLANSRCNGAEKERNGDEYDDDSDLHSIELNVDSNSKNYKWSYVEPEEIYRRNCPKFQWENSDYTIDMNDSNKNLENSDGFVSETQTRDQDEIERDKSIKNLRDYILSSARFVSPTRQWNQSLRFLDFGDLVGEEDSLVLDSDSLKLVQKGTLGGPRNQTS